MIPDSLIKKGKYWTKAWNPVTGCTMTSTACEMCWAAGMAHRFPKIHGEGKRFCDIQFHPDRLPVPLSWRKPQVVAVCWMGDLFHEDVPFPEVSKALRAIGQAPQHYYLLLTKRPKRMLEYYQRAQVLGGLTMLNPGRNLWFGVSAWDKDSFDTNVGHLMQIPGNKWVSLEPMLGEIDVEYWLPMELVPTDTDKPRKGIRLVSTIREPGVNWIVAGAETGRGARPANPDWFRSIRAQCAAADVPFFLKQMDAKRNRKLDGRTHNEFPEVITCAK